MKKFIALFLSLAFILTLAACGGKAPTGSSATAESGKSQSADSEIANLKELYDGKWINEDPLDSPFTMEVLSTTGISMTYEASGEHICDLFYFSDELTSISVSMGGISLGKYSIDTETRILTYKPDEATVLTYKKEK